MSYILKALKRVENEKNDREKGEAGLAVEILSGADDRAGRRNWLLPAAAAGFVLLVGIGIFLLAADSPAPLEAAQMVRVPAEVADPPAKPLQTATSGKEGGAEELAKELADSAREAREIIEVNRRTADALQDTAESLRDTAVALEGKVVLPPEALVAACEDKAPEEIAVEAPRREPLPSTVKPAVVIPPRPAVVTPPRPSVVIPPRPSESRAAAGSSPASSSDSRWGYLLPSYAPPAELNLSEIYYSPEVKDRMAVVNDLPVMEGVMVDGARVDRIFRDRVRLVVGGKYKEILLAPPE